MTFEFGPEDNVFTIGTYLQKVREEKKIKLEDVSVEIKIHSRFLRALEEDDEENYPDDIYRDLFLKSYAEYLGINLEEIALRLPDRVKKKNKKASGKRNEINAKKVISSGSVNSDKKDQPKTSLTPLPLPNEHGIKWSRMIVIIIVIIVAALVVYTKYFKAENTESNLLDADTVKTVVAEMPETTKASMKPLAMDTMYLLFVGIDSCWLGVEIDGDSVFNNILTSSDTIRFALQKSASFKLGRANSIEGWLNGLPLKLGSEGDSSTVQYNFTIDDYSKLIDSAKMIP